jgi:WD40 repeat protein
VLEGHTDTIYNITFSEDGKLLASGSKDKTVKLWDIENKCEIATLEGHKDIVTSTAFSADNKMLATGSSDLSVIVWDVSSRTKIVSFEGHEKGIHRI